jgi:hypothetical protein
MSNGPKESFNAAFYGGKESCCGSSGMSSGPKESFNAAFYGGKESCCGSSGMSSGPKESCCGSSGMSSGPKESFCGNSAAMVGKVIYQPMIFREQEGDYVYNKWDPETRRTDLTIPLRFAYFKPPIVNPKGYRIYQMGSWRLVVPRNVCKEKIQSIYDCIALNGPAACGYMRYYDTLVPNCLTSSDAQLLSTI